MGTNYYWHSGEGPEIECPHCGEKFAERVPDKSPSEGLHIGKSSAGWAFALRIHPDQEITDLAGWKKKWAKGRILSEYGDVLTVDEMMKAITQRSHPRGLRTVDESGYERFVYPGEQSYFHCDHEFS